MKLDPIPSDYPRVTPYLAVDNGKAAIEFYAKVFGMSTENQFDMPDGRIGHVELVIGGSKIMLSDEYPEMGSVGPKTVGGTPVGLSIYVKDVDDTMKQAVDLGAKVLREAEDQFHGDRSGQIEDPFGHKWFICSRIENVSPEEMQKRAKELFGG